MSYYQPNIYTNYPYPGQSNVYNNQFQPQPNPAPTGLNGKMVDSLDMAKVTDIPFGGYGVFPKADMSEVYIKSWNNNGTTNVVTYQPVVTPEAGAAAIPDNSVLLEKITALETKLDNLFTTQTKAAPTAARKELSASAY